MVANRYLTVLVIMLSLCSKKSSIESLRDSPAFNFNSPKASMKLTCGHVKPRSKRAALSLQSSAVFELPKNICSDSRSTSAT